MKLPSARTAEIIEQDLGKELLIYDLRTNKAYTLNETLMKVYRACDGATAFDELRRRYKFTADLIHYALDQLQNNNLIIGYESTHFAGLSRREVVRRVGLASVIALPVIVGIVAPGAAQAQSDATCQPTNCSCVLSVNDNNSEVCNNSDACLGENCACFFLQADCFPSDDTKTCFGTCSDFSS